MGVWEWLFGPKPDRVIRVYEEPHRARYLWLAFIDDVSVAEGSIGGKPTWFASANAAKGLLRGGWRVDPTPYLGRHAAIPRRTKREDL